MICQTPGEVSLKIGKLSGVGSSFREIKTILSRRERSNVVFNYGN
jgi:hypothetical protein